jgi:hypothetical protein
MKYERWDNQCQGKTDKPTSRVGAEDFIGSDIIVQLRWTASLRLVNREVVDAGFSYF